MRVIAGEFRGRRLKSLPGLDVRPTPDRLRESLFNILAPRIEATVFVDAYAGTGAVGIEALSRGAARAVFIERARAAVSVIRDNLASLALEGRAEVFVGKAANVLTRLEADIVFLDPPYHQEAEYRAALEALAPRPPEIVLVQHHRKLELPPNKGELERYRFLAQGENCLTFYRRSQAR